MDYGHLGDILARKTYSRSTFILFLGFYLLLMALLLAAFGLYSLNESYSIYAASVRTYYFDPSPYYPFIGMGASFAVLGVVFIVAGLHCRSEERKTLERVRGLSSGGVSPREFLNSRGALMRNGDFTGIYVIHNLTKDMYYVGQSTRVVGRVSQHFCGRGNGDVYADYKYGDEFEISLVSLCESGYESLDALERDTIKAYDAYEHGYNRTRGNRN